MRALFPLFAIKEGGHWRHVQSIIDILYYIIKINAIHLFIIDDYRWDGDETIKGARGVPGARPIYVSFLNPST